MSSRRSFALMIALIGLLILAGCAGKDVEEATPYPTYTPAPTQTPWVVTQTPEPTATPRMLTEAELTEVEELLLWATNYYTDDPRHCPFGLQGSWVGQDAVHVDRTYMRTDLSLGPPPEGEKIDVCADVVIDVFFDQGQLLEEWNDYVDRYSSRPGDVHALPTVIIVQYCLVEFEKPCHYESVSLYEHAIVQVAGYGYDRQMAREAYEELYVAFLKSLSDTFNGSPYIWLFW